MRFYAPCWLLPSFLFPLSCVVTYQTKGKQDLLNPMHMYYINLDRSIERREHFESNMALLPQELSAALRLKRVAAIDRTDVDFLLSNGTLTLNNVKPSGPETRREGQRILYTNYEIACTLSHLKTIMQAYSDGHEFAMIVEDDAILTVDFLRKWEAYALLAPKDWTILQWTTNNPGVNRKESHVSNDFWISWTGHHWSTIAYTIKRAGMKRILHRTSNLFSKKKGEKLNWSFDLPSMILSDEILYFLAGNAYTSTYAWVTDGKVNSTFGGKHNSLGDFGRSKHAPTISILNRLKRSEKIVVIQNTHIRNMDEMRNEIRSLGADISFLAQSNPESFWFVKVVLAHFDLLSSFQRMRSQLPRNHVQFDIEVSMKRFNKFVYFYEKIRYSSTFDLVLLKDNDIRISGFEWNTFLNKRHGSLICGPYLMDIEGLTARQKQKKSEAKKSFDFSFGFQDALLFNNYRSSDFQNVASIPVMGLEMFMVLMTSDFALWFFSKALTYKFLAQDVDWGPDLIWCGAAFEYMVM